MNRFLILCSCAVIALTVIVAASNGQEPGRWFYTPPPYPFYAPPSYPFYAPPAYPFYSPPPYAFYSPPPYPFYAPPGSQSGQPFFTPFTPLEKLRPLSTLTR